MKTWFLAESAMLALFSSGLLLSGQSLPDSLADRFYPPDLVRLAQPALNLTEEQQAGLAEAVEKTESKLSALRARLRAETSRLDALTKAEALDPEALMRQADKAFTLERDLKLAQLALLIKIKATLTPEQLRRLNEFKRKAEPFRGKIRQAQELADKRRKEGRDLAFFEQARAQFDSLLSQGDFNKAELLLEQTIKRLSEPGR